HTHTHTHTHTISCRFLSISGGLFSRCFVCLEFGEGSGVCVCVCVCVFVYKRCVCVCVCVCVCSYNKCVRITSERVSLLFRPNPSVREMADIHIPRRSRSRRSRRSGSRRRNGSRS